MCKAEQPVVTAAQEKYEGEVQIIRVSTNRPEVFAEFGVPTQPAWAFIDDDGTVSVEFASFDEEGLFRRIDELIAS